MHVALNQDRKDAIAVVYRVLTDNGSLNRVRVIRKECVANEIVGNKTKEGMREWEEMVREGHRYGREEEDSVVVGKGWEDFVVRGNFQVTALSFINGDTLTYSRYLDYYQFRILKRTLDPIIRWVETH